MTNQSCHLMMSHTHTPAGKHVSVKLKLADYKPSSQVVIGVAIINVELTSSLFLQQHANHFQYTIEDYKKTRTTISIHFGKQKSLAIQKLSSLTKMKVLKWDCGMAYGGIQCYYKCVWVTGSQS